MRPHHLTITAFGPFAATEHVDFDDLTSAGLFLMHGETGAGKTSVLDAVCFALYGSVPNKRPRLRSDHADPALRTEVVLDLSVAGRRLKIRRSPKQSYPSTRAKDGTATVEASVELHEWTPGPDGHHHWHPVSASNLDAGHQITDIIGLTRAQFCQVVLLPQGDFASFLRVNVPDRRLLLSRLFGTSHFHDLQEWLNARSHTAKNDVDTAVQRALRLTERIDQTAGPTAGSTPLAAAPPQANTLDCALPWAKALHERALAQYDAARLEEAQATEDHGTQDKHHQHTRDLAADQLKYNQALAKRAALQERATGHAALRERLEQGRRAEPLRPLLAALIRAQDHLDWARRTEQEARSRLGPRDADGDVPQLELAQKEHHAAVGQAETLLPDETLHQTLGAELQELNRKAAKEGEDLEDASAWLEQWPALLQDHSERVARSARAADEVPRLAERERALEKELETARLRDELGSRLAAAGKIATECEGEELAAQRSWLDLRQRRMDGMAGELAGRLTEGSPCEVCGSTVHPDPAALRADQPTLADDHAAQQAFNDATAVRKKADAQVSSLTVQHAEALGAVGDTTAQTLTEQLDEIRDIHRTELEQASQLIPQQEALAEAQSEQQTRTRQHEHARENLTQYQVREKAVLQQRDDIAGKLSTARAGAPSISARIIQLTQETEHLTQSIRAAQDTATAVDAHDRAQAAATAEAEHARFPSLDQAVRALQSTADIEAWQSELDQWGNDQAVVDNILDNPALIEASRQPPADPQAARTALDTAVARSKTAATALAQAQSRITNLEPQIAELGQRLTALTPLQSHHALVTRLADIASAKSSDNTLSMELEAYVLAARLEDVVKAANERLTTMSDRYTLIHSDEKDAGQRRAGLNLRIQDTWTGNDRETSTLSGGETFIISLALALGLADVVTHEAGGRTLDTLFIDEGFGTLDEKTLQDVLNALDQLRAGDRAVGIVSHVADLRGRINVQLHVRKNRTGSTLHRELAADF